MAELSVSVNISTQISVSREEMTQLTGFFVPSEDMTQLTVFRQNTTGLSVPSEDMTQLSVLSKRYDLTLCS